MNNKTTSYVEVITDCGRIKINCLLKDGLNLWEDTESITFYSDYLTTKEIESWDNPVYIKNLYKNLWHRNYEEKEVKEFENFCQENGMDFNEMEKVFIGIYKAAEELGMFKN